MEDHFWRHILYRLQAGELIMRARPYDGHQTEDIPADMLDDAEPDFANNRVKCGGVMFRTVRISLAAEVADVRKQDVKPEAISEPSAAAPGSSAEVRAWRWMQTNVTIPGQWQREFAIADCRKQEDVTARVATAAWTKLEPNLRGARGKHKKR